MKHIIKLSEQYGMHLRTRMVMEQIADSILPTDEYLLDFSDIEQISRSAADELYTMLHENRQVETINLSPFVQKMLDAVKLGRFQPRQHDNSEQPKVIVCSTLQSVSHQLIGS